MTALAPTMQAYFTDRLIAQRSASPNTIATYRHTFRLLLRFAIERTGKPPSELDIAELDAPLIAARVAAARCATLAARPQQALSQSRRARSDSRGSGTGRSGARRCFGSRALGGGWVWPIVEGQRTRGRHGPPRWERRFVTSRGSRGAGLGREGDVLEPDAALGDELAIGSRDVALPELPGAALVDRERADVKAA
jgi:hypothetical protein